jgi:hypothetical protein
MQPTTSSNKAWYWVIAIIIIAIIAWIIWGGSNASNSGGMMGSSTESMNNGAMGANGGTGSESGNGAVAGSNGGVPAIPSDATLTQMINASKVRVPQTGADIALTAGQGSYTNGTTKGQVSMGSILGKVTTTDGYDVFVNMGLTSTDSGKTTSENYVALFNMKGDVATYTSAVLIGNGLPVTGVDARKDPSVATGGTPVSPYFDSAKGYLLMVTYLDRKNGEPTTTTPSLTKDFTAHVKNHVISK